MFCTASELTLNSLSNGMECNEWEWEWEWEWGMRWNAAGANVLYTARGDCPVSMPLSLSRALLKFMVDAPITADDVIQWTGTD